MAPGLVCVSNLWYCMFWAGKRGRRSSAGSLESNVEVSRKHPVQLAILCHPPLVSMLSYFALPSPSCRDTDLALPPCLPPPCMQLLCLEASMPLTACSDPRVGQREGVDFVFSSPLKPCSLWFPEHGERPGFQVPPRAQAPPAPHSSSALTVGCVSPTRLSLRSAIHRFLPGVLLAVCLGSDTVESLS